MYDHVSDNYVKVCLLVELLIAAGNDRNYRVGNMAPINYADYSPTRTKFSNPTP